MSVALREEICRIGASLYARGYVHAAAGNISVRTATGYLITPTDACLGRLDPATLAEVDDAGVQVGGERASKTLGLHRRIYDRDPDAHCVIHTHATHCVALTLAGVPDPADAVPPITPYFVMKVGHVPLIRYHVPGDPAVGDAVARCIDARRDAGTPIRAVLLERLGPIAWHATPADASAVLEELEETAKLWMMLPPSSRPMPLDEARIEALRVRFGAHW